MKILRVGNLDVLLDDWDWLCQCGYKWRLKDNGTGHKSVVRTKRIKGVCRTIYMHREIMDTPKDMEVHHKKIYGDAIDNRKENLENLTKSEHSMKIGEYFETYKQQSIQIVA
jgi:wobble nucleotide-excising tRNase